METPKHAVVQALEAVADQLAAVDDLAELSNFDLAALVGLANYFLLVANDEADLRNLVFGYTTQPAPSSDNAG